ncbi:His-Xaa-Ser system radical SAM maturase HxsC [Cellulophaga sp. Asnod2-G02]|uniref:His-Xaa-Ser system radical SAM maturase HxsC n=1 Tax=Cellulophaga sp. Asnod2-G02 TaxID=3160572 RepID=UPI003867FFE7
MVEQIKLTWKAKKAENAPELFVGQVKSIEGSGEGIIIITSGTDLILKINLTVSLSVNEIKSQNLSIYGLSDLEHITVGDILLIKHRNIRSIYRIDSPNNSIFATIRCNSNCLMCSQPPLDIDDTFENYIIWDKAIDYLPEDLKFIGFTGGEPTLLGQYLINLVNKLLSNHPNLIIDILSNGRLQARNSYQPLLKQIIDPSRVVFAIPLYSDIYKIHDYIVQAKDAYFQTILGIHKMAELGFLIEIRVVLHKLSVDRLEELAKFTHKNFPFIYHITFMGLELIGYTKANKDLLIVEENESINQKLLPAIDFLNKWDYNISIYNTPLCHLPIELRPFAKQSISDWKNSFHPKCSMCVYKLECSGFFSWNLKSSEVYPILEKE